MLVTALGLFGLLAIGGWWLARRISVLDRRLGEMRLLRRELGETRADLERSLAITRSHLAALAAGETLDQDVVRRGSAYRDVQPGEAVALYEKTPDLFVLDVRTPAEWANGHIPNAHLIPLDELEDRLSELPSGDVTLLVTCAAGGRSSAACQTLGQKGFTRLLNLVGGMHTWPGPRVQDEAPPPSAATPAGTDINYRGGPVSGAQVVDAIRQCFDPEIPLNIYDLGLIYGIDIDESTIAVKMTLTSEACPSARSIPDDVKRKIVALGQENVTVDVTFSPPWHPSRISSEGKTKLGLA